MKKRLLIGTLAFLFLAAPLAADGRKGPGSYSKENAKEWKQFHKEQQKQEKTYWKHVRKQEREYLKWQREQDREYRKQQREWARQHSHPGPVYRHGPRPYPTYPRRTDGVQGRVGVYLELDF